MRRYLYLLIGLACFGVGAYAWRVQNLGLFAAEEGRVPPALIAQPKEPAAPSVVKVGDERISRDDIDWEYNLLTEGVFGKESLTPIPDLGPHYLEELSTLRRSLVSTMIERKMLYQLVKRDHEFNVLDPARYTSCMTAWQQALQSAPFLDSPKASRDRLKTRLCERALVDQYLKERLYSRIELGNDEVVEYYKNHSGDFKLPERVTIRHILLGSEQEARKWRLQVNAHNFETIARQQSLAPEGVNGGLIGPFGRGRMPAVFEVAFRLEPGSISEVLKSDYGYHVVMLLQRLPKQQLSLDAAKLKIAAILRKQKEEQSYSKWVEKALSETDISTQTANW